MNIFRLDDDAYSSAKMHCNKHVPKMACEQTQILHTTLRFYNFSAPWLYKSFNPKHPSCLWSISSRSNFLWIVEHGLALCEEYTHRYKKVHKCRDLILLAKENCIHVPDNGNTKQYLAMPDQYHTDDPVHSYRLYYSGSKYKFAKWEPKQKNPNWWDDYRKYVIDNNLEVANDKNDGVTYG